MLNRVPYNAVIGLNLSAEEVALRVKQYLEGEAPQGWSSLSKIINAAKSTPALRWANPLEVKAAADKWFEETFGAKELAKPKAKVCIISPIAQLDLISRSYEGCCSKRAG